MRIAELLTELTFMGRTCTKECSGHQAGYAYGLTKGLKAPANTPSKSFNSGTELATNKLKNRKIAPAAQPKQTQGPNGTI